MKVHKYACVGVVGICFRNIKTDWNDQLVTRELIYIKHVAIAYFLIRPRQHESACKSKSENIPMALLH